MRKRKPKELFFDLETSPMQAWVWRTGDQVVRHDQLVAGRNSVDIICITYCWGTGPAYALTWDKNQCSKKMIAEFDKIVQEADIIIGQNSDGFDVKHINTQRMLHGLPPLPHWADTTDDLLKQLRKYFKLPSNSLDFVSSIFGYGGKIKMGMQDWIDILENNCPEKLKKMIKYGKKDVLDTRACYRRVQPYIKPKFNMSTYTDSVCCVSCGGCNLFKNGTKQSGKNGTKQSGKTKYQTFGCKDCGRYAGKRPYDSSPWARLS